MNPTYQPYPSGTYSPAPRCSRNDARASLNSRTNWYWLSWPAMLVACTGHLWLSWIVYFVHRHILITREYNRMNGIVTQPWLSAGQRKALKIVGYSCVALLALITFMIVCTWFGWMGFGH